MAQQISVNVYKINSQEDIPLSKVVAIGFPTAGIMIRGANQLLSTGVYAYAQIQLTDSGATYLSSETQAALITRANA